jgi:flagella basal body P-ring formation protein FlgA
LALICVCCGADVARAAVIEIKDRAIVDPQSMIRLRDVARVSDVDLARRAQLEEITLAPPPAAGRSARMTYDDIRSRLLAHGVNLAELEFRGRSQVMVNASDILSTSTTATRAPEPPPPPPAKPPIKPVAFETAKPPPKPLPEAKVSPSDERRAQEIMQTAFQREFRPADAVQSPLKFRCELLRDDVRRVLAAPADKIRFEQAQLISGGPQPLTAWWPSPDEPRERLTVQLQAWVDRVPLVLGVKHAIPKGYPLNPSDLAWMPAKDSQQGLTRLSEAVGKETTRPLRPGQLLEASDVASVPLVRPNDIVTVQVRRPGIVVRREFKAQSGGALQETVNLVALDDPRTRIQAVVTGYHEATIIGSTETPSVIQDETGAIQFEPTPSGGGPR